MSEDERAERAKQAAAAAGGLGAVAGGVTLSGDDVLGLTGSARAVDVGDAHLGGEIGLGRDVVIGDVDGDDSGVFAEPADGGDGDALAADADLLATQHEAPLDDDLDVAGDDPSNVDDPFVPAGDGLDEADDPTDAADDGFGESHADHELDVGELEGDASFEF